MAKADLTAARLREVFDYCQETGVFIRRMQTGKNTHVGKLAGTISGNCPYVRIGINDSNYRAHRLAFLWMTGEWPKQDVDHIDGDPTNNAWANLRDVSKFENLQNIKRARSDSGTGVLGAQKSASGRYLARIKTGGKVHRLGLYLTAEQAHAAYMAAKARLHPGASIANDAGPAPEPHVRVGTSGLRGVHAHKGRWAARLSRDKKSIHIGVYATKEEASEAYRAALAAWVG